ncbi:MAG: large ribosomal subunit protein bL35 [Planctomycetota bacterium]|jgi:large subunit ribosomal protein L35
MPKQKTSKVRRNKAFRRHLLAGRSTKRKRQLRRPGLVSAVETRTYQRLLGEG